MVSNIFKKLEEMLFEADSNFDISDNGELTILNGDEYCPLAKIIKDFVSIDYNKIPLNLIDNIKYLKNFLGVNGIPYREINKD